MMKSRRKLNNNMAGKLNDNRHEEKQREKARCDIHKNTELYGHKYPNYALTIEAARDILRKHDRARARRESVVVV